METLKENQYILNYWHKIVSIKESSIILSENNSDFIYSSIIDNDIIDGWYAKYYEGAFVFFKNSVGDFFIGWQGKIINIEIIHSMTWTVFFHGRLLECYNKEGVLVLDVSYNTLKQYTLNPIGFLLEFIIGDDDWGLVADLPSFIQSCFDDKCIEEKFNSLKINGID